MLIFSLAGFVVALRAAAAAELPAVQPAGLRPRSRRDLAFNTSVSFVTNTNWQSYGRETTMSYLVQMAGLTVHNFVSAATGIALAVALVRGFARRSAQTVGNFWVDMTRCTLYILLPISIVVGLFFVWQGMPQNLGAYIDGDDAGRREAVDRAGPGRVAGSRSRCSAPMAAASSTPIPRIRSRIPTALTNLVQMVLIFSIGAALTNVFGRMVGDQRQGWAIFAVMGVLFLAGVAVVYWAEAAGNPAFAACMSTRRRAASGRRQHGRQGGPLRHRQSALFATVTTDASCGAVNAMHDSFMPLGGMVPHDQHHARRDHLRRRRLRSLRHAAVRHRRGVHRRPDGRPHAGISRQEDRGARR